MHTVIGVMGGGHADEATCQTARRLGARIAEEGWVLLNGGRDCGVMAASARGAHEAGGLVLGILPGADRSGAASDIDLAIVTGMGDARNVVNVLTSDVVIALPGGAGTLSEVAHALKLGRPVITLGFDAGPVAEEYRAGGLLRVASDVDESIAATKAALADRMSR